ncbi:MAG: hypothetical protein IPN95_27765 [Bacteroidetes bacterium]|nr:hypothetical protein [Bacteroidota bacterium]
MTGCWAANVVTISGTPTASGTFTYTVTTTGGCPPATTTGTITVTPLNTVAAGTNQTVCINSPLTSITLATTGATGATVTGLPAGVTGSWAAKRGDHQRHANCERYIHLYSHDHRRLSLGNDDGPDHGDAVEYCCCGCQSNGLYQFGFDQHYVGNHWRNRRYGDRLTSRCNRFLGSKRGDHQRHTDCKRHIHLYSYHHRRLSAGNDDRHDHGDTVEYCCCGHQSNGLY